MLVISEFNNTILQKGNASLPREVSLRRSRAVQFLPQYYDPAKAPVVSPQNGTITRLGDPYNGLVIPGNGFPDAAKGRILQYNDPAVKALFHNFASGRRLYPLEQLFAEDRFRLRSGRQAEHGSTRRFWRCV